MCILLFQLYPDVIQKNLPRFAQLAFVVLRQTAPANVRDVCDV
jgi:hypothetical protein